MLLMCSLGLDEMSKLCMQDRLAAELGQAASQGQRLVGAQRPAQHGSISLLEDNLHGKIRELQQQTATDQEQTQVLAPYHGSATNWSLVTFQLDLQQGLIQADGPRELLHSEPRALL